MTLSIRKRTSITLAKPENWRETIFCFAWGIHLFHSIFIGSSELCATHGWDFSLFGRVQNILLFIVELLIIITGKYWSKERLRRSVFFLLLVLGLSLFYFDTTPVKLVLVAIVASEFGNDRLLKFDVIVKTVLFLSIVVLCMVGFIDNYTALINGNYKESWGFGHPNQFTLYGMAILLEWLCVYYKRLNVIGLTLGFVVWYIIKSVGGGRSTSYTAIVILILFVIAVYQPRVFEWRFTKFCFAIVTPFMVAISFFAMYLYSIGNKFIIELNALLTGRISCAVDAVTQYGIKLVGQTVDYVGSRKSQSLGIASLIVDNTYVHIALSYGLIFLFAIVILMIALLMKLLRAKRYDLALFALFFILVGFGENALISIERNVVLFSLLSSASTIVPTSTHDSSSNTLE